MAIKVCPECGGKVAGTRNDCPHCGYIFTGTVKCPECNSDIPQDSRECPVCGYAIDKTETETLTKSVGSSAANLSGDSVSYNGKLDGVFSVVQDYNADDFSRELYVTLARDSSTPSDIISACTVDTVAVKKAPYLVIDTDTQVEFSCSVGYDREEQYWEEVEKKDSQGNRYKTQELKTRTVTDWQPFKGTNSGSDTITVANNNGDYPVDTSDILKMTSIPLTGEDKTLFGDIVPSPVALSVATDAAKRICAESAKKPGDHQKDLSYHGKVNVKSVKAVVVPRFEGSYNYEGQRYGATGYAAGEISLSARRPSIEESQKSIVKKKTRPTFIISVILTVLMIAVGVVLEMLGMLGVFGNDISNIIMIVAGVLAVVFLVLIVLMWIVYISIKRTLNNIYTFVRQAQKIKDIHEEFEKRGWQFLTESEFNSICSPELTESTQKTVIKKTDQLPFSQKVGIRYKNYILSRALKLCGASEGDNDYTSDNTASKTGKRKKRRNTGKIVTIVVSAVLVVALGLGLGLGFGLKANNWSEEIASNGIVYKSDDGKTCYVSGYEGKETSLTIPSEYKGKTVTAIAERAFYDRSNLTDIKLPNGLTKIGSEAFNGCTGLTGIEIPNGVTEIDYAAFAYCTNLKTVTIPNSVERLDYGTFDNCKITTATLPAYILSSIPASDLETVIITGGYEGSIGYDTFRYFKTDSGYDYSYISNLKTVIIQSGITYIDQNAFDGCSSIENIEIQCAVTDIGYMAFSHCTGLTSIVIPNSVENMGDSIFYSCGNLIIYCEAHEQPIRWNEFWNSDNLPVVWNCKNNDIADDGNIYYTAENGMAFILNDGKATVCGGATVSGELVIPNAVTYKQTTYTVYCIQYNSFSNCNEITSVKIPNTLTEMYGDAFYGCDNISSIYYSGNIEGWCSISGLESLMCSGVSNKKLYIDSEEIKGELIIPTNVTEIGSYAFYGCTGITSITIPDTVTSIAEFAFEDCSSLTSITIADSVTSIGWSAFYGCSELTSVYYKSTETDWNNISIDSINYYLTDATRYYYSETEPNEDGNYWHYVNSEIVIW
ncbi:MAG: leucine-rich repeat protein [Roseburia sp.]|nr:leucine-rich repeat protein [Corallococcus sp.]MCM1439783.1 leucine-rich repeat protein [Roseburia sp.]